MYKGNDLFTFPFFISPIKYNLTKLFITFAAY